MSDTTWDKVKPWVAKIAPMLGTALGGPLGGAAGALLSSALGPKATDPDAVQQLITTGSITPEQILALKQAEQQFTIQLKQMDIDSVKDLESLAVQDRASARQREIAVKDLTPAVGFYLVTVGFFGLLAMMLFHVIPEANQTVLNVMVGALGTAWVQQVSYFYGSSRGSQAKDALLFNSTPIAKE